MRTQIVLLADAMAHTQLPRPLRVTRYKPSPRCTCAQGGAALRRLKAAAEQLVDLL